MAVRIVCFLAVALAVSAMLGTAASAASNRPHNALALGGCKSPAKFRGLHADNYETNCFVCKNFGPKGVAREYRIRSANPVMIAQQYARKAYRPAFRQAVFEGCLRGFRLRAKRPVARPSTDPAIARDVDHSTG